MSFNSDPTKPAHKVIFSWKKVTLLIHIYFNDISVERASHQKHCGVYLDEKLNFIMYVENVLSKVNAGISFIKKLKRTLPRKSLLII